MVEPQTIEINTGTESSNRWALCIRKSADKDTENSESVNAPTPLHLLLFKGYANFGHLPSIGKPNSLSCPLSTILSTLSNIAKYTSELPLLRESDIDCGYRYSNVAVKTSTLSRPEASDILRQARAFCFTRFETIFLPQHNAEGSTLSGPEWLPELNIPSGSQILRRRIESLFAAASDEVFEEGMNSRFSERLASMIEQYEIPAVLVSSDLSILPETNSEVAYETMRLFGRIDHSATYEERMNALTRGLRHSLPRVRDGAALGLASLNDPQAAPALKKAIDQERCQELRDDMEQVLEQLE